MKKNDDIKMQYVNLQPETIVMWKNYCKLKKWFYKLIGKELPYNKLEMIIDVRGMCWQVDNAPVDTAVFEPIKRYGQRDISKLRSNYTDSDVDAIHITMLVNKVRPNAFVENSIDAIRCSKYYRVIDLEKEARSFPKN